MALQFLQLDWRVPVPRALLIEKLDDLFTSLDASGAVKMHLFNSTAKFLVKSNESGLQHDMILQKVVDHAKKYQRGSGQDASPNDKYLARLGIMIEHIMQMISSRTQTTPRNVWYRMKNGEWSEDQVDQMVRDIALTIGVHPHTLGVVPELQQSIFCVPKGIYVDTEEVRDIFRFASAGEVIKHRVTDDDRAVRPMYKSVTIKEQDCKLRAVVVCEHRSIKNKLAEQSDKPGFEGILLVLTGGFPNAACREFLHLLAVNPVHKDVPFLWLSDCDAHSLAIYSCLKFGSAQQAYASPSMVCPQLVFGGLTVEKFEKFCLGHPQRFLEARLRQDALSDERQAEILSEREKMVQTRLDRLRTRPFAQAKQGDRQRITGLKRLKTLSLPNESDALNQLVRLDSGGAKLSFISLDEFESSGCAFYIAEQVAARRREPFQYPAQFEDWSQRTREWNARQEPEVEPQDEGVVGAIDLELVGRR